jgi:DNA-binding transcriptional LysR family regulator
MELRQLLALESVLATGSFSAAAAARYISQPALWAQIKNLEEELGFALFQRSGRGVAPTSACLSLQPSLRTALADVAELRRVGNEIREGWAAPARIGCGSSFVSYFLAGCIRELRANDPRCPFPVIVPITSQTAVESLTRGHVDLVVEPSRRPSRADAVRLYDVDIVVVGSGADTRGNTIDIRALDGLAIATLPPDSLVRPRIEAAARRAGISLRVVYESRDPSALLGLAREGVCSAVVHDELPTDEAAQPASRLVDGKRTLRDTLWLEWISEEALSPAARALRDVMRRRARQLRGTTAAANGQAPKRPRDAR